MIRSPLKVTTFGTPCSFIVALLLCLAWSSWNSTTAVEGGGAARGGAGRRRIQGGKAGRRRQGQGEESEDGTYFQSGHIAEGKSFRVE